MAKGDVAATFTLAPDVDKLLDRLAAKRKVSRKQVVSDAIRKLAAEELVIKGVKA